MTDHAAALTEAYHAVYDVKDKVPAGSQAFVLCYEACSKIADLMTAQGFTPPERFDGQGRTKIKAVKIEVPFSEAPGVIDPRVFEGDDCWTQCNRWLRAISPPKLGYYKTDVIVTYADGETYQARYDIGADSPTLGQHIRDFIASVNSGAWDPSPEALAQYNTFAATYEIGD